MDRSFRDDLKGIPNRDKRFGALSLIFAVLFCVSSVLSVFLLYRPIEGMSLFIAASAFLFIFNGLVYFLKRAATGLGVGIMLLLSLIAYISVALLIQWIFVQDVVGYDGRSSFEYAVSLYFMGLCWLFAGASIQFVTLKSSNFSAVLILSFLLWMIYRNLNGGLVISYYNVMLLGEVEGVTHLSVGDSTVFLLVLSYALATEKGRPFIFLTSLFILFALGGRTALYVFAVTGGIYGWLYMKRKVLYILFVLTCVITYVQATSLFLTNSEDELFSRMLLSGNVTQDSSFVGRSEFFLGAVQDLPEQFFFGNPGLIVNNFGNIGSYMHNILSAWQFFGAPTFGLMIGTLFFISYFALNLNAPKKPIEIFGVYLLIYVVLCCIFSRAVGFYLLWFVMGFWLVRLSVTGRVPQYLEQEK